MIAPIVTYGHSSELHEQRGEFIILLVRRAEVRARPWGDPVPFHRIVAAPLCTCCEHEVGRRRLPDQKGAARSGDLLVLDLLLPSTQREIRRIKDRKRREARRRATEDRVLVVFAAYGDGLRAGLIAEAMAERAGVVRSALRQLATQGRLVDRGRAEGWFRRSIETRSG